MATSRKSDLQRQLRELDEQRARLVAELRASEQEAAAPPSDEDDLVNEGINFAHGTRDGDEALASDPRVAVLNQVHVSVTR